MIAYALPTLVLLLALASADARRLSNFKLGIVHEAIREHVVASVEALAAKHPLVDVKVSTDLLTCLASHAASHAPTSGR